MPQPEPQNSSKLDPRLRALLKFDREELFRVKREDDRRCRAEFEVLSALRSRVREVQHDKEELEKTVRSIRERTPVFPVPLTFGLYLPEVDAEAEARATRLEVPYVSAAVRAEVSVQDLAAFGVRVRNQAGDVFTTYIPLEACYALLNCAAIDYIELACPLLPQLIQAIPKAAIEQIHVSGITGAGVIIGVIDTGLDFYHEHFLNPDRSSRVLYLWDQGLIPQAGQSSPPALPGFNISGDILGVEYSKGQIDAELRNGLPAYRIVRSNPGTGHTIEGAHGTLVASCAAGGGHLDATTGQRIDVGAAPEADIIHVRIDESRYLNAVADSNDILDAFSYIFARAALLQKACVINLSLSASLGAHDGNSNAELFLDNLLLVPGRAITCSAGNENISDLHTTGKAAQGGTTDVKLTYGKLGPAESDDTIQVWYDGHDEFEVTLTVPTVPATVIGPIVAGTSSSATLASGVSVSVESLLNHPSNHDNLIEVRVTNVSSANPIPSGDWALSIRGMTVINGAFDAWIDRFNAFNVNWQYPVFDAGTINVPATARRPISVGAHRADGGSCLNAGDAKPTAMDISGCGPTRDGRVKPDIVGPGQLDGARSRDMNRPPPPGYPITDASYGTSNAAPVVAGAAALLFQCRGGGVDKQRCEAASHELRRAAQHRRPLKRIRFRLPLFGRYLRSAAPKC